MPSGLPLNGIFRNQPAIRRRLSSDVQRGVHIGVYVLASARELAVYERGHYSNDRVVTDRVIRLVAPAAHGRDVVVIVTAAPHGTAERQGGQVGTRVIPVRPVLSERGYRGHDQRGSRPYQVGVSQAHRGQNTRRRAVHYHVRGRPRGL